MTAYVLASRSFQLTVVIVFAIVPRQLSAQEPPKLPLICEDCWPTECLGMGTWTAAKDMRIYARPGDTTALSVLRAGESFDADSSLVRTDQIGMVVLLRDRGAYKAGDTIYVLRHDGEAHVRLWHRGQTRLERPFWDFPSDTPAAASLVAPLEQSWWLHVRSRDQTGWLRMPRREVEAVVEPCG